ncbi:hypothetical protein B0F90DRAFT_1762338, partial [Multifurca ochricompacta]
MVQILSLLMLRRPGAACQARHCPGSTEPTPTAKALNRSCGPMHVAQETPCQALHKLINSNTIHL